MKRDPASFLAGLPFLFALCVAWLGVDFGWHWDENHNKIDAVAYSLEHGFTLLPDGYTYPGVNYWLTLATVSPELGRTVERVGANPEAIRAAVMPFLRSEFFVLRLRHVYAFVALLAAIWIFLAIREWGETWPAAFFGASLYATSWQVIYHSRWAAPDAVLAQFGALALLFLASAWKGGSRRALALAAISAGLGAGTKYPGGLLLLPVIWTAAVRPDPEAGLGSRMKHAAALVGLFGAAYLLTTPGSLLQPIAFYKSLAESQKVYAGGWYGYTVVPGWSHLGKIVRYLSTQAFSRFSPIALLAFLLALAGAWRVMRENVRSGLALLLFPVCYLLYFSLQATMVVRNYLVAFPFAAVLAGLGLGWLFRRMPGRGARVALFAVAAGLLALDGADQISAAVGILHRPVIGTTGKYLGEFVRYADRRPAQIFVVSDGLADLLRKGGDWPRPNLHPAASWRGHPYDVYAGLYSEIVNPRMLEWPTNRPGMFRAVFGPREVDLDYYILWSGNERILCLSPALAASTGVVGPPGMNAARR